ncbi:MAG: hypothetical protein ACREIB_00700 [Pseudomonadota bacterium]
MVEAEAVPPTASEVQATLTDLFNKKGFEAAAAVLNQFKVERGSELPAEKRADFIRAATAAAA